MASLFDPCDFDCKKLEKATTKKVDQIQHKLNFSSMCDEDDAKCKANGYARLPNIKKEIITDGKGNAIINWNVVLDEHKNDAYGITFSTINEEVLHIGQINHMLNNPTEKRNELTIETEAKATKVLAYYNIASKGTTDINTIYNNYVTNGGFGNYELDFLFDVTYNSTRTSITAIAWAKPQNFSSKDAITMEDIAKNPRLLSESSKTSDPQKAFVYEQLFNQQVEVLSKGVFNLYKEKKGFDKKQKLQDLTYFKHLINKK